MFDALLILEVMEVLRYKDSLCQWMYKEKGKEFIIFNLAIYNILVYKWLLCALEVFDCFRK